MLQGYDGFNVTAVCYYRQKNLRDLLLNTVLEELEDIKLSEIMNELTPREALSMLVTYTQISEATTHAHTSEPEPLATDV
jgi:hypothetical protein